MTQMETVKVLEMLSAFYGGGKNDPKQQAIAWHMILEKYDFNDAMNAVLRYAESDKRDYAAFPGVGRIVDEIRKEAKRQKCAINEIIRAVGYGRDYETLSDDAKRLIPKSSYQKWLDVDAEEFSVRQEAYATFLRKRQFQLEGHDKD